MLRTLSRTRDLTLPYRLIAVAVCTLLTVVSARVSIPLEPVPFTLQPLMVLLSGLVLGARDGALSQLAYIGLIALNLPVDARMVGAAAFASPTGGFLIGFVAAAWTAGWLSERGAERWWVRWLAGVAALVVLYAFGAAWMLIKPEPFTVQTVWQSVIVPFIGFDLLKALIAAALTETGRRLLGERTGSRGAGGAVFVWRGVDAD
jgi:biotin transport system substrate-specific component